MYDVTIVGGGLGGLIASILLSEKGLNVLLLEKKQYPFHRVCGEYISNEVIPFLESHDIYPSELDPVAIDKLLISSVSGSFFKTQLDLGGFGLSRYAFDNWLATKARSLGVTLMEKTTVSSIDKNNHWTVSTTSGEQYHSNLVISAHGKRAKLDQQLKRNLLQSRSPYVGVKYHITSNLDNHTIALHNFVGGYCGVSRIESNKFNICYLAHRDQIKKYKHLPEFEHQVVLRNPHLREIWDNSEFLFDKPEVINEITFRAKEPVLNGIIMIGDSAGMITPLAGNGMAMAIRSAALASKAILDHYHPDGINEDQITSQYQNIWRKHYQFHLAKGRVIQKALFSSSLSSSFAVFIGRFFKNITNSIIEQTHGEPFSKV